VDTATPKIDGKQTQVVKTEDVPRARAFPLQPALPAPPAKEPQEEAKAKPSDTPGDLTLAKPDQTVRKEEEGEAPKPKPRTVAEAKALLQNSQLSGEKMKQEGGVKRARITSSLDVRASPFGNYDAAIIAAVQNRWYDLLDRRQYARDRIGKVTLRFRLNSDGSITELEFVENTVDLALGLLCQSAIKDPSPYGRWPMDMRRIVGAEYREVTFTFYYN
jgi:outer membrane biosynthesis protein TonB